MHIGRRPAGVCGACLLLAARMNNFRRSIAEVVQVVKIADVTLRKRLGEFRDTPSGGLTVADFRTLWLDETADPPAFLRSQNKEKKDRERKEGKERDGDESDENDDDAGEESRAFNELAKEMDSSSRAGSVAPTSDEISEKSMGNRKREEREDDEEDEEEAEAQGPRVGGDLEDDPGLDEAIAAEVGVTLSSKTGQALVDELDKAQLKRMEMAGQMTNLNDSERLDDLDEDELEQFILTEEEAEAKSRLWMEMNRDYLQALAGTSPPDSCKFSSRC